MDLTNEDVADVLAVLDSLPYDELDLQTPRFRLILRRTPDGWTQSVQARSEPSVLEPTPDAPSVPSAPSAPGVPGSEGAPDAPEAPATGPMLHRPGYNRTDAPSTRLRSSDGGADEAGGVTGAPSRTVHRARADAEDAGPELVAVRAPLPGTFYRAPRPGAAPFVQVGSRVGTDTVVGIVETMKLMNSVTAGVDGEVAEICVGNAEFVELGATLLRIRTD
jgi:acetyl-CoA carboxylase biotin carboxyl carrier protein